MLAKRLARLVLHSGGMKSERTGTWCDGIPIPVEARTMEVARVCLGLSSSDQRIWHGARGHRRYRMSGLETRIRRV